MILKFLNNYLFNVLLIFYLFYVLQGMYAFQYYDIMPFNHHKKNLSIALKLITNDVHMRLNFHIFNLIKKRTEINIF